VLLHGFTGAGDAFDHLHGDLPFRGLAPDLPGHAGGAPASGWDDTLEELAAALGPAPAFLYGYSMGGRLALAYALRFPERVRALAIESGSPGIENADERAGRRADDEALARSLEREGLVAFLARWEQHPTLATLRDLPETLAASLLARRLRNTAEGLASALRCLGAGTQPSLWARLQSLAVPALLIAGERDARFSAIARAMAERIPRARLRILSSAGHAPHLEAPRELARALTEAFTHQGDRS
jgi:2-succinyl-6-hydroxy-2,4-cyclohexadiene-1-carboxylate synthase